MKKKIFIYFIIVFSLLVFLPFNTMVSADINIVLISDFDDVASGLDSGTSYLFDFKNVDAVNLFETCTDYDLSSPNSLKINGDGYLNLTTDFEYVYQINFSMYFGASANDITFSFYDYNDVELIQIKITSNEIIYWYDDVDYDLVYDAVDTHRYYFIITHLSLNLFNFTILDNDYSYLAGKDLASKTSNDWNNFSYIFFNGNVNAFRYLDNFYIDVGADVEDCNNINYVLVNQDGLSGIHNVIRGSTSYYNITAFGDAYAPVYMWITLEENSIPLVVRYLGMTNALGLLLTTEYVYYQENMFPEDSYKFIIKDYPLLNPICDDYYYDYTVFTVNATDYYNFTEDLYAEFQYHRYDPCALVGDDVDIVYHLPKNDSATNKYEDFYYAIALFDRNGLVDYFMTNNANLNKTIYSNGIFGEFKSAKYYHLEVWNMTNVGTRGGEAWYTIQYYGSKVYDSGELRVWSTLTEYYEYLYGDDIPDDLEPNIPFSDLSQDLKIMIGLMVSIGLGVGLMIVSGEGTVFPIVSGLMVFVLSRPEIDPWNLFPETFGVALLVLVVVMAFIIWLLK